MTVERIAEGGMRSHVFLGADHARNERRTWLVIGLASCMMVGEIVGGSLFGSMALIADGLHMSTHAGALIIAAFAYTYARRHATDTRFSFGTGKLGDLAGFTSAIVLAMIALLIGYEAVRRLLSPVPIAFEEAIPVAVLGLTVNLASAWLLRDDHDHGHAHGHHNDGDDDDHHGHHHDHGHRDNNLRAAYVHVLADAATSVLAILGLLGGWAYGWVWMDPMMGIAGALVVANWSYGLARDTGGILLDLTPDRSLLVDIQRRLETNGDRLCDLHVWRVGPGHYGAIAAIITDRPREPEFYKEQLRGFARLSHVTIEVNQAAR
jgi:cation diffusion facilitator family transporter